MKESKNCFRCKRKYITKYNYFCRGCYKKLHRQIQFTDDDSIYYMETSFNYIMSYNFCWNFRAIHLFLLGRYLSVYEKSLILEKIIF
jgi:hypothetical protein